MKRYINTLKALVVFSMLLGISLASDCMSFEVGLPSGYDCSARIEQTLLGYTQLIVETATPVQNYAQVRVTGRTKDGTAIRLKTQYYYGGGYAAPIQSVFEVNPCGTSRNADHLEIDNFWEVTVIVEVFRPTWHNGKLVRIDSIGTARIDGTRDH